MALIVETGLGLPNAEAYQSVSSLMAYCDARGLDYSAFEGQTVLFEQALRRATSYIDNRYRNRFTGYRTNRREQALEWPRNGAYVQYFDQNVIYLQSGTGVGNVDYDIIDPNTIPPELINATSEAACRELVSPGSLTPDLDRGNAISSLKAGSVAITYASGAPAVTVYLAIEQAISGLLLPESMYSGTSIRG